MKGTVTPYPYRTEVDPDTGQKRRVPAKGPRETTWTYSFSVGSGPNRKHHTRRGYPTKGAAQSALTEALAAYGRGEHVAPSRMTLGEYLEAEWLPTQARKKASTVAGYRAIVEGRIVPALGDVRLTDLTAGRIAQFYADLRTNGNRRGKKAGPLSEQSVRNTHTLLTAALKAAAKRRLIPRSPMDDLPDDVKPRKVTHLTTEPWSAGELAAFLAASAEDRLIGLWTLAALTGMREGELLGLTWRDVDLEQHRLSVRRARVNVEGTMVETTPKSASSVRTVDLGAQAVAALRRHRARQAQERLAWGEAWTDTGHVFTREDGEPLHADSVRWRFESAIKAAGVRRVRFHDLRHCHATIGLASGVPARVMQERLGHSSVAITLNVYSHTVPGMGAEAAAAIEAAIGE